MQLHEYSFRMAQPVWETGTAHTMNRTVSFCTDIPLSDLPAGQQIRLAAAASCSRTTCRMDLMQCALRR